MLRIHETIDVAPEPEATFAFLSDFSNLPRWDPSAVEVTREDAGPIGVGSAWEVQVRFRGQVNPMRYAVTEYAAPERVVLVGENEAVRAVDTISCAPHGSGTRVVYDARFRLRGWRVLATPFVRGAIRQLGRDARDGLARALQG